MNSFDYLCLIFYGKYIIGKNEKMTMANDDDQAFN